MTRQLLQTQIISSDPDYADPNTMEQWRAIWPRAIAYNYDATDDSEYYD